MPNSYTKPVSATNISGLTDGAGNSGQSYNHPGGMGDRSASITTTSSVGLFASGSASGLVNGNIYDTSQYFFAALNASSHWIKFDFGTPRKITEAKWFQSGAVSHGTWKWQGSNDDSSYADVGTSFTLGATAPQTHTSLNGNTVAYRYWKLVGVSGTTSSSPYINECEFKLNDGSAVSATSLSVPGQASFTGTTQFSSLPVLPRQAASTFLGAPLAGSDFPVFRYVTRADIGNLSLTPSDMPWCGLSLSKSANQSISAGNSSTHCTWDVELVAEASPFTHSTSSTTEEVTVNLTGKVRVSGVIQFDVTSSGGTWRKVYAQIKKNGTVIAEPESAAYDASSAYTSLPIVIDIVLALSSGDVIKILPTSYHAFDILGQSSSKNKSTLTFEYLGA